jgi:2-oxoglutarate dehydrogenase E2 component (dihydrolipoamide succinyltransferase)
MPAELRVPQMGESISEATVLMWLKSEGDSFAAGDDLVELETDKANSAISAPQAGVLTQILHKEGDTVGPNDVLAILGDARTAAASIGAPVSESTAAAASENAAENGRPAPHATPLAARVAAAQGVDLAQVQGSGVSGRIRTEDVQKAAQSARQDAAPVSLPTIALPTVSAPPPAFTPGAVTDDTRVERRPMTTMRKAIAAYLKQAQNTAAMLTTFNEIDMGSVMELRKRRKEAFEKRHGVGLGFMSFFTKAAVGALKAFPLLNAEIQGTDILIKHFYDIGIAVSTKDGLVVPVVRDADRKTFADIEKEIGELAGRAREKKISPQELKGGTFTITNGGVFGSLLSTPILNYPQVGILGMHKIEERPIAQNGQVVIRHMMYLALSYDHRIVDGSEAVRFLVRIKELIEDPETLLLEG